MVQDQSGPGSLGQMATRMEADALLLVLGPRPERDVGRWLHEGLRAAVVDGRLEAGAVLPSSRETASALGVSRGTVTATVDVLVGEGLASLPRAVALVTSGPARAAGLTDRGEIVPGARADLVLVRSRGGWSSVVATLRAGAREPRPARDESAAS